VKRISYQKIKEAAASMCMEAASTLPRDVEATMRRARDSESSTLAKSILDQCLENASIAREEKLPICQDTGTAVYFVEYGMDVQVEGGRLEDALREGTAAGYESGRLRKSIVNDPVFERKNTGDNTPPVVHLETVPGEKIRINLCLKGGGSENMSALKMLKPSDGRDGVVDFVVDTVVEAGGNPCPPTIVGVGIGGTAEKCVYLAKKALLRETGRPNPDARYAELESEILQRINASGVGPQGLGGSTTALAVHVEHFPCHIASLPVAVNLNCHAARHSIRIIE
jgi:fumarate hydratase subunit alpha